MPGEKPFAEVRRMLERAGYQLVRVRGSHHYFTKAGAPRSQFPCIKER